MAAQQPPGPPTPQPGSPPPITDKDEYERRMRAEVTRVENHANGSEAAWRARYRGEVKTVPMTFWRDPRVIYGVLFVFIAILAWVPTTVIAAVALIALNTAFGTAFHWGTVLFVGTIFSVLMPIPATFYWSDQLFQEVDTDEIGVMEFWGRPLQRTGFEPLQANVWLAPRFLFFIKKRKLEKVSRPITGSDDITFEIAVQGTAANPAPGQNSASADLLSVIEFGGRFNLNANLDDIRDIILLNERTGGIEKAADRIAESIITAMRRHCSSVNGPQTQYEALGFSDFAAHLLRHEVLEDAIATGTRIETITSKIQLPEALRVAIVETGKEDTEKVKEVKDAQTAARVRAIGITGNPNITDEQIAALALDPRYHLGPADAAILALMASGKADPDSFRVIKTGGDDSLTTLLAKGKEVLNATRTNE